MRQIQKLNYGICINSKVGYCELTWTQSKSDGEYAFTLSGDASLPAEQLTSGMVYRLNKFSLTFY